MIAVTTSCHMTPGALWVEIVFHGTVAVKDKRKDKTSKSERNGACDRSGPGRASERATVASELASKQTIERLSCGLY